jgi:hypothetical protein
MFAAIVDEDVDQMISGQGELRLIKLAPGSQIVAKVASAAEGYPIR